MIPRLLRFKATLTCILVEQFSCTLIFLLLNGDLDICALQMRRQHVSRLGRTRCILRLLSHGIIDSQVRLTPVRLGLLVQNFTCHILALVNGLKCGQDSVARLAWQRGSFITSRHLHDTAFMQVCTGLLQLLRLNTLRYFFADLNPGCN